MTQKLNDAVIDRIISHCNGDTRGALRALLLVNEQLEHELQLLLSVCAGQDAARRAHHLLH